MAGLTSGVIAVSLGMSRTCAVTIDGNVKCWGLLSGSSGTLTPTDVPGLPGGITFVSAGNNGGQTCASNSSGGLWCWSYTDNISPHNVVASGIKPYMVSPDGSVHSYSSDIIKVSYGLSYIGPSMSCLKTNTGIIRCWGLGFGETPVDVIGFGPMTPTPTPSITPTPTSTPDGVPNTLYVAPSANCGGQSPCYATIQSAIEDAGVGATIKVAEGTYTSLAFEVVTIDKPITLSGGYSISDWNNPDSCQPSFHY